MQEAKRYRRIPSEIDAIQWTGDNQEALQRFGATVSHEEVRTLGQSDCVACHLVLWVEANQAWLPIQIGEWIARDEYGYYPIKDRNGMPHNYEEVNGRLIVQSPVTMFDQNITNVYSGPGQDPREAYE